MTRADEGERREPGQDDLATRFALEERTALVGDLSDLQACLSVDGRAHSAEIIARAIVALTAANDRAALAEAEVARLTGENQRLRIAFHDATRRPLGVTPDSGVEFYDQRMADEAEERRVARSRQTVLHGLSREEAEARAAALGDAQRREHAARTALKAPHADGLRGADAP